MSEMAVITSWTALMCGLALTANADDAALAQASRTLERQLRNQVMPYWYDQAVDRKHGGYSLESGSKQLVSQVRMVWGFSHAHRLGYGTADRDYLAAARQGYEYLVKHFLDKKHGGYFWLTEDSGAPINRHKMIYGQAFVIYGFVEYYRASQDAAALERALELFQLLQQHAHDTKNGGWIEHFSADWTPVMEPHEYFGVEVAGYKSANAHLHLMEAFTELYLETQNQTVREALAESLRINRETFYPLDPAQSVFHRYPDWSRVDDPNSQGISYGHNVEFAWLMLRAQEALQQPLAWDHYYAHLDHALRNGFDHETGGLYNLGHGNQPATDRGKVWWSQAELMAALAYGSKHRSRNTDREAMRQLLRFLEQHMIDAQDGIWAASVSPEGITDWKNKRSHWKANYHDVRAVVMFIQAAPHKPAPQE